MTSTAVFPTGAARVHPMLAVAVRVAARDLAKAGAAPAAVAGRNSHGVAYAELSMRGRPMRRDTGKAAEYFRRAQ